MATLTITINDIPDTIGIMLYRNLIDSAILYNTFPGACFSGLVYSTEIFTSPLTKRLLERKGAVDLKLSDDNA